MNPGDWIAGTVGVLAVIVLVLWGVKVFRTYQRER